MPSDMFRMLSQGANFRQTRKTIPPKNSALSTQEVGINKAKSNVKSSASTAPSFSSKPSALNFFQTGVTGSDETEKAEEGASDENENLEEGSNTAEDALDGADDQRNNGQNKISEDELRRQHKIRNVSSDCPAPWATFDDFQVPSWIVKNARRGLRFETPTPIQMQCCPAVLTKRDVLASAPTGSGKTMAFLLPLLASLEADRSRTAAAETKNKPQEQETSNKITGNNKKKKSIKKKQGNKAEVEESTATTTTDDSDNGIPAPRLVVVDPTRELAQQTLREFVKLAEGRLTDFSPSLLDDEGSYGEETIVAVSTPQKLEKMLEEKKISLKNCRYFVLDEVDKLLDLGFREQIDNVLSYCNTEQATTRPATLFFSATLPENVVNLAETVLLNPLTIHVGLGSAAANPDVEQKLVFIGKEDTGKLFTIKTMLKTGELKLPCIVFLQSKDRARQLFQELRHEPAFAGEKRVDYITAERKKEERDTAVENFRTGKTWVLICTDLMSRGVDLKHVEMVVNYDLPLKQSTYIHRIGRTGRAGKQGKSVTFFTEDDFPFLRPIVNVVRNSGFAVAEWMLQLKKPRKHRQERGGQIEFHRHIARKDIRTGGVKKKKVMKGKANKGKVAGAKNKPAENPAGGDSAKMKEPKKKKKAMKKKE
ncbi:unnamed protein product [Amoebophrya sp. A120]|nr:unnamed protein product [Amoebophrya sp. A120]|eukprot:GSA120T00011498001.1